jgi:hypothetical protein
MNWKDLFLIPWNVQNKYTQSMFMIKSFDEEFGGGGVEEKESLEKDINEESLSLRGQILDKLVEIINDLSFNELYLCIFGDYPECLSYKDGRYLLDEQDADDITQMLISFPETDVVDKLLVETILRKFYT